MENEPGVEIVNRFQIRDRQLEEYARMMKSEMDTAYPNGALYLDSLGESVARHIRRNIRQNRPPNREKAGWARSLKT